jgi:hypothetical protein
MTILHQKLLLMSKWSHSALVPNKEFPAKM